MAGDGVSPEEFRRALSEYATGVTAATAMGPAGPSGATANAVTSLSLDPPLMLACLDRGSRTPPPAPPPGPFPRYPPSARPGPLRRQRACCGPGGAGPSVRGQGRRGGEMEGRRVLGERGSAPPPRRA